MNTLTTEEIQIVKRAVGLLEVDFNTFRENLIRDQMMTSGEAHNFAEKALTARVIQIAQGRVRMTPPPPDPPYGVPLPCPPGFPYTVNKLGFGLFDGCVPGFVFVLGVDG